MECYIENNWIHLILNEPVHPHTVLEFLDFYHISRKQKYLLIQQKHLLLNDHPAPLYQTLHQHDQISIYIEEADKKLQEDTSALDVVYEDDVLLIVNKPSGLLIHNDGTQEMTLSNRVQHYYTKHKINTPVRPIHRLDKDTTGLVVFCKLPFFQPYLDHSLANKELHREYMAAVKGSWNKKANTKIELPIARDRHNAKKMRVFKNGKYACTYVACIKETENCSLLQCRLTTGRTHQIRVHLSHVHHPILRDDLYGNEDNRIKRLALHAFRITMIHPITQKSLKVEIPLPDDMNSLFYS